jgi:hypothetical protein
MKKALFVGGSEIMVGNFLPLILSINVIVLFMQYKMKGHSSFFLI